MLVCCHPTDPTRNLPTKNFFCYLRKELDGSRRRKRRVRILLTHKNPENGKGGFKKILKSPKVTKTFEPKSTLESLQCHCLISLG